MIAKLRPERDATRTGLIWTLGNSVVDGHACDGAARTCSSCVETDTIPEFFPISGCGAPTAASDWSALQPSARLALRT